MYLIDDKHICCSNFLLNNVFLVLRTLQHNTSSKILSYSDLIT